jgi:hypothetical protein
MRKFLIDKPVDSSNTINIQGPLEFMLSHFSETLFPRNVSTAATGSKQKEQDILKDKGL